MIDAPKCHHDRLNMPAGEGWIVVCLKCYEAQVRKILLDHSDTRVVIKYTTGLDKQIGILREQVQQLEADNHDMRNAKGLTFLRCTCGRLHQKGVSCRGCGI